MALGRTLFISDLHLDATTPPVTNRFLALLRMECGAGDELCILGDLFETWIGDDDAAPDRAAIRAALRELTQRGVQCRIMHGNRDFLLGTRFMAASGCELLPDPTVRQIGASRYVFTHGDALCTRDLGYQRFRRFARNGFVQWCWRALPLALRRRIAAAVRRKSRAYTRNQPESIMDVTPAAVTDLLRRTRADVLVHGHTHRPAVHQLRVDGRDCQRIVLGDWPARASVLIVDADGRYELRALASDTGVPE